MSSKTWGSIWFWVD